MAQILNPKPEKRSFWSTRHDFNSGTNLWNVMKIRHASSKGVSFPKILFWTRAGVYMSVFDLFEARSNCFFFQCYLYLRLLILKQIKSSVLKYLYHINYNIVLFWIAQSSNHIMVLFALKSVKYLRAGTQFNKRFPFGSGCVN